MSTSPQSEFNLAPRPTNEVLAEKLSALVAQFNDSQDALERAELHLSIVRIRGLLERLGDS